MDRTLLLACAVVGGIAVANDAEPTIRFDDEDEGARWFAVNDGVMGGASAGRFVVSDSVGVFVGSVSLENNGGFASVRRQAGALRWSDARGVRLRVRGDGKTYRFRIKTDDAFDGVFYQMRFETRKGEWIEPFLPFDEFQASFRGRRVEAPPLDAARIRQIGFLIAEKQEGPFRLEIDWIRAESPEPPSR